MNDHRFRTGFLAVAILAIFCMAVSPHLSQGQPTAPADWSTLKIVAYDGGATGFFDPKTGMLYIYGPDLLRCERIRQLEELGENLKRLRR